MRNVTRSAAGLRLSGGAAALAALGVTLAGCSAGAPASPQPTATVTVTARPAGAGAASPAGPGSPASPAAAAAGTTGGAGAPAGAGTAGAGTAAAAAAPCLTRYLDARAGLAQGTAGSTYQVIQLKNLDNVSCTLYGYPGVSFATGLPVTQVGLPATEDPSTPRRLVTLPPGGYASAVLRISHAASYPAAHCHPVAARYLQIYPPNQANALYLWYAGTACAGPVRLLTVTAVQPGSGGS